MSDTKELSVGQRALLLQDELLSTKPEPGFQRELAIIEKHILLATAPLENRVKELEAALLPLGNVFYGGLRHCKVCNNTAFTREKVQHRPHCVIPSIKAELLKEGKS